MPLSKTHKAAARGRIVSAAGKAFRANGFDAASVAGIMADAGLTHGGFYAHFPSKQALFAEVAATDHDLLARLTAAKTLTARAAVLDACLDPANVAAASAGCTLSALAPDAARLGGEAAAGLSRAFEAAVASLQEVGAAPARARAALCLALGALAAARAAPPEGREATLAAARAEVGALLAPAAPARRGGAAGDWGF
ncbi:MAG: helix-turn-helix domain-containing protein [Pseudomonadota bacterium]